MCSFCFHFPSAPVKSPPTPAVHSLAANSLLTPGEGGEEGADAANVSEQRRRRRGLCVPLWAPPAVLLCEIIAGWCAGSFQMRSAALMTDISSPASAMPVSCRITGRKHSRGCCGCWLGGSSPSFSQHLPHAPPGNCPGPPPASWSWPRPRASWPRGARAAATHGARRGPAQTVTDTQRGAAGPSSAWG